VISLQVGDCWLWTLIIFLIHRSLFSVVFIPHEYCTPLHMGGLGGISPPVGSRGKQPPLVGVQGEAPEGKIVLVNVYCNFIVNLDCSL
jgi:hypothetical protein